MTTSNEHYGKLNVRFDERSVVLRQLGFDYIYIPEWDTAVFARKRPGRMNHITVPATFVMHADERCWQDRVGELQNQFASQPA